MFYYLQLYNSGMPKVLKLRSFHQVSRWVVFLAESEDVEESLVELVATT